MPLATEKPPRLASPEAEAELPAIPAADPSLLRVLAPYAVAVALTLVFYAPLFLPGSYFKMGDYFVQYSPNCEYSARRIWAGHLPEWTSELLGGYPFLSDPQTAVFYPPNFILGALFPRCARSSVMDMYLFLHVAATAAGAVFLARSLGLGGIASVGVAVVAALNGFNVMHLGHVSITEMLACGIWGLAFIARGVRRNRALYFAVAGLFFACAALLGHPQMALFVYAAAAAGGGALAVVHALRARSPQLGFRLAGLVAVALLIGAAGAAAQILPTRELLKVGSRFFGEVTFEQALANALPMRDVFGLWFPNLYHTIVWRLPPEFRHMSVAFKWAPEEPWEYLHHFGMVAFGLGLLGWLANLRRSLAHILFFGALALVIGATGKDGGIYPLLYHHLPGFQKIRIPGRLLWPAIVCWSLLAGLGVESVVSRLADRRLRRRALAALGMIVLLGLAGVSILVLTRLRIGSWVGAFTRLFVTDADFIYGQVRHPREVRLDIAHQIGVAAMTFAFCIVWLAAAAVRRKPSPWLGAAAVGALLLDLGVYGFHRNISRVGYPITDPVMSMFRALPPDIPGRLLGLNLGPEDLRNTALLSDYEYVRAYCNVYIRWQMPFLPAEQFSHGNLEQEKRQNVYNVSHLAFRTQYREAVIRGTPQKLLDAEWVEIGKPDPARQEHLTWETNTLLLLKSITVLTSCVNAEQTPDGTEMAQLQLLGRDNEVLTTYPLRLGIETQRWNAPIPAGVAAQAKPSLAFRYPANKQDFPNGAFFVSAFDIQLSAPVTRVRLMALPSPAYLCVSHIQIEDAKRSRTRLGLEGVGHRLISSRHPEWSVIDRFGAMGNAWLVPQGKSISYAGDYGDVKEHYASAGFNPRRTVLLNAEQVSQRDASAQSAPNPEGFAGQVSFVRKRPERLRIKTESNQPGWLLVSNTWYPGWTASVDGKPSPVVQADGSLSAVAVPAGKHNVHLDYRTPSLQLGMLISGFVWFGTIVYILVAPGISFRRGRQSAAAKR